MVAAPAFAIRKPAVAMFTLDDYARAGIMSAAPAETLRTSVAARANILVAGGIGTIHAGTALGALRRMEQLIQEAVVTFPRALLAETIDLIAVLVRDGHGRRLAELARVEGLDAATGDYRLTSIPSPNPGDAP